jgi:hypothetical protein
MIIGMIKAHPTKNRMARQARVALAAYVLARSVNASVEGNGTMQA